MPIPRGKEASVRHRPSSALLLGAAAGVAVIGVVVAVSPFEAFQQLGPDVGVLAFLAALPFGVLAISRRLPLAEAASAAVRPGVGRPRMAIRLLSLIMLAGALAPLLVMGFFKPWLGPIVPGLAMAGLGLLAASSTPRSRERLTSGSQTADALRMNPGRAGLVDAQRAKAA